MNGPTSEQGYGPLPEMPRRAVRGHDANFPAARKPPPDFVSCCTPNSLPPIATDDKEFRHVPDISITGNVRAFLDQNETRELAIHPDQKRMPGRIAPVKRKVGVIVSAIRAELYIQEIGEVVYVQLKQIRENRLFPRQGCDNFQLRQMS